MKVKPEVFIASSVEGLPFAHAIQENLQHDAACTVWNQGVFFPSSYPLEALDDQLRKSDFGVFVFSPDDALIMRDQNKKIVRDNVMIELGMSIGQLGRRRSFIVAPSDVQDLHFPSDLMGISPVTFESKRSDNILATLGPACSQIRTAIKKLGKRQPVAPERPMAPTERSMRVLGPNVVHLQRPEPVGPIGSLDGLSLEAKTILLRCSKSDGYLRMTEVAGGLRISGGGELYNGSDGRQKAEWFDAIRSVHSQGFMRQIDNTAYELTKQGWLAGDMLRFADFPNADALHKLSRSGRELLVAAIDDPYGQIMLAEDLSGFSIVTNQKDFCEGASGFGPRSAVKDGLFALERIGLIRKTSAHDATAMYEVTSEGQEVAKAINAK